jgi:serine/threonine-protein kinase CHEK2
VELIDQMLQVNPADRYTIDDCLAHPWTTAETPGVNDSTNGLVSGIAGLGMNRRGAVRERTLLSSINDVQVTNRVPMGENRADLKIYSKNPKVTNGGPAAKKEMRPDDARDPTEFAEMGGKGDQPLYGYDGGSVYSKQDISETGPSSATKPKPKGKGKGKANGR